MTTTLHRRAPLLRAAATLLTLAASTLGCADRATPTSPVARAPTAQAATEHAPVSSADRTRHRLEQAAAGLLYTSESDSPFDYVFFAARARAPLTAAAFRAAAGVPSDSLVEARTLDEFFARHIERVDPGDAAAVALVPRYRRLKRVLRAELRGVRLFRVGQIAVRCYVVGVDARGNVVGLATTAIET